MYDRTKHRDPWENQPFLLDDDPILPEGWGLSAGADSGEEEGIDQSDTDAENRNGADTGERESAEGGGGTDSAAVRGGGTAAPVDTAGPAGEHPALAGGDSGRKPDSVSGRGLGEGAVFPSGDGAAGPLSEAGPADGPEDRLHAQAQAARVLYPELRELSDREAVAVALGGAGTLGAYADFRARETARLRQENALLRQNQEALRRAPVRGVSGGAVQTRGRDPFETGFDEDGW